MGYSTGTASNMVLRYAALLLALTTPVASRGTGAETPPMLELMPDICQMDEAFHSLPGQGGNWCAPAAVANILIALELKGSRGLIPGNPRSKTDQLALLEELGKERYLGTGDAGTQPLSLLNGLAGFLADRGYQAQLEWQGWRRGGPFQRGDRVDQRWLQQGVSQRGGVVLNIGWYRLAGDKIYQRFDGHYVTLVGYRAAGDITEYWIQDPAPRSGPERTVHAARLRPIPTGALARWNDYPARDARRHFFVEGIVIKPGADAAILDGAMRFALAPLRHDQDAWWLQP